MAIFACDPNGVIFIQGHGYVMQANGSVLMTGWNPPSQNNATTIENALYDPAGYGYSIPSPTLPANPTNPEEFPDHTFEADLEEQ